MADSKISDLTAGTVAAADDFAFVQSGTTKTDTIQGILDLVPASSNLGSANLTANAAERKYILNGNLSTDLLTIETNSGTDILQFRGDDSIYSPSAFIGLGQVPSSSRRINMYVSTSNTTNIYAQYAGANGVGLQTIGLLNGAGIGARFQHTTAGGTGARQGIILNVANGATNWAMSIEAGDVKLPTSTGVKFGTGTTELLGFWGTTPIAQPSAMTTQLTDITGDITPSTPDYVVAATSGGWGFGSQDEFETAMNVINNLQTRVQELEDALSTAAGGSGLIA